MAALVDAGQKGVLSFCREKEPTGKKREKRRAFDTE